MTFWSRVRELYWSKESFYNLLLSGACVLIMNVVGEHYGWSIAGRVSTSVLLYIFCMIAWEVIAFFNPRRQR